MPTSAVGTADCEEDTMCTEDNGDFEVSSLPPVSPPASYTLASLTVPGSMADSIGGLGWCAWKTVFKDTGEDCCDGDTETLAYAYPGMLTIGDNDYWVCCPSGSNVVSSLSEIVRLIVCSSLPAQYKHATSNT